MGNGEGQDVCKGKHILPLAQDEKTAEDGDVSNSDRQSPRAASLSSFSWIVLCSSLLLAELQAALDSTMTANLQPIVIDTFGEISKFPWINVTYSLGMGGSCLLCKKILIFTRLLFATGSVLTAAAPSMNAFIVGKAITGIGSGGSYIAIIIIITALTSPHEHGRYFGYIGFVWGLGTILGPSIGGAFAVTAAGWRWSFYFNLILVGLTFPVFLFILPSRKTSASPAPLWIRVLRIDIFGSVVFAGALCSGIMAVSFGGALYSWNNGAVIGLFCCSGVLWVIFAVQQATATFTTKEDRLLPLHILHSFEMLNLIIQTGCSIGMLFITIYYIPLYFQFVRGESAIRSAVDLLPFLFTSVSAMLISGRLITNFGYYKVWFIAGSSLSLAMSVCLYTTEIDTSHSKIYGYLIVGGVGTGLYAMNAGPVMSAIVAKEHVADAGAVFGCVDALCGAFAVGITNSIFVNRASNSIQKLLPRIPRATVQQAIAGVGASLTDKLPPSLRIAVLRAALNAIKEAWVQMIATAALSIVLSFFLRNRKLSDLAKR
ncbi:MAG: hypothetical protein Q9167_002809 [Letrouitia subvulpina]